MYKASPRQPLTSSTNSGKKKGISCAFPPWTIGWSITQRYNALSGQLSYSDEEKDALVNIYLDYCDAFERCQGQKKDGTWWHWSNHSKIIKDKKYEIIEGGAIFFYEGYNLGHKPFSKITLHHSYVRRLIASTTNVKPARIPTADVKLFTEALKLQKLCYEKQQ